MDLNLDGKVFMVAGASRGLGFGIARALLEEGASVSICSRDDAAVQRAIAELAEAAPGRITGAAADVTGTSGIESWYRQTCRQHGNVHGLVANSGGPPTGFFDDLDDAAWQHAFELNLLSAIRLIRTVLPSLRETQGTILVSTSSSAREPIAELLLSNVMRAGVASLAKSLSRQFASEGIRVNNLVPGVIATDRITDLTRRRAETYKRSVEEQHALAVAGVPLGRLGSVDEYARAAAFLLSDAASYITGATLVVDGGTMRCV